MPHRHARARRKHGLRGSKTGEVFQRTIVISEDAGIVWMGNLPAGHSVKSVQALLRELSPSDMNAPYLIHFWPKNFKSGDGGERRGSCRMVTDTTADAERLIGLWNGKEVAPGVCLVAKHCELKDELVRNPHLVKKRRRTQTEKLEEEERREHGDVAAAVPNSPPSAWSTESVDPQPMDVIGSLPIEEIVRRLGEDEVPEGKQVGQAFCRLGLKYERHPRPVKRVRGEALPADLAANALAQLRLTTWPGLSDRSSVNAANYLVLKVKAGEPDPRHPVLRDACMRILAWADPGYPVSAIAVTRNFVGSPHIDHEDSRFQYAISLGDFEGGELCVESIEGDFVYAVDTRGRIARVDGRNVHWVRKFTGERFSVIFYCTREEEALPVEFSVESMLS